jgi:hypothetical protein
MRQNKKHCMYAAACFFDLNSRALITTCFKCVTKGRLHGVLPLHHDECCSNLQGPVKRKRELLRLVATLNALQRLLATIATRPNFTSLHFSEIFITVMATTTDKITASFPATQSTPEATTFAPMVTTLDAHR